MGTRLHRAPVCFTVAQIRFNPVLAMEPFLPALQDAFRAQGFPDYEETRMQSVEIQHGEQKIDVRESAVIRHVFRNKAQTASLLLDAGALTYELTDYPEFDTVLATFVLALRTLHTQRAIEYSDRLGMRMLDAVQAEGNDAIEDYLSTAARGLQALDGVDLPQEQAIGEGIFRDGPHCLVVRTLRRPTGLAMPADLMPMRLKLAARFVEHVGDTLMLDCDAYRAERRDYNEATLIEELRTLKRRLSASFKAIVTPRALAAWA